ncbi:hypothetical protein A0H81_08657 [Grifola frondosa]|uniref:Fungal-type protein kinase domain-containing protein n=1 Tax=Grifola frondosa TaxID=5627 RepID=A0A1C7M371_GRIFR|nr:hypothetical protein A0H81_08657 [Grifola frondosa]
MPQQSRLAGVLNTPLALSADSNRSSGFSPKEARSRHSRNVQDAKRFVLGPMPAQDFFDAFFEDSAPEEIKEHMLASANAFNSVPACADEASGITEPLTAALNSSTKYQSRCPGFIFTNTSVQQKSKGSGSMEPDICCFASSHVATLNSSSTRSRTDMGNIAFFIDVKPDPKQDFFCDPPSDAGIEARSSHQFILNIDDEDTQAYARRALGQHISYAAEIDAEETLFRDAITAHAKLQLGVDGHELEQAVGQHYKPAWFRSSRSNQKMTMAVILVDSSYLDHWCRLFGQLVEALEAIGRSTRRMISYEDVLDKDDRIHRDISLDNIILGTWRYMSYNVLDNEDVVHSLSDDMESLLYVVLYCSLRWLPHDEDEKFLAPILHSLFDYSEFLVGRLLGGNGKYHFLSTRRYVGHVTFAHFPIQEWLNAAADYRCVRGHFNVSAIPETWSDPKHLHAFWTQFLASHTLEANDRIERVLPAPSSFARSQSSSVVSSVVSSDKQDVQGAPPRRDGPVTRSKSGRVQQKQKDSRKRMPSEDESLQPRMKRRTPTTPSGIKAIPAANKRGAANSRKRQKH